MTLDHTGKRYGKLTALHPLKKRSTSGQIRWRCLCDCGKENIVLSDNLKRGQVQSCGCNNIGKNNHFYKHGLSYTNQYKRSRWLQDRATRKTRMDNATIHTVTSQELDRKLEECGGGCYYCGGPFEHWDHYQPLSKGGLHEIDNLLPSCAKCNLKKHNKIPCLEWEAYVPV